MYSNDGRDNNERTCKLKVKQKLWNVIWEGRKNDLVRHLVVAWVRWDKKKWNLYWEESRVYTYGLSTIGLFQQLKNYILITYLLILRNSFVLLIIYFF